MPMTPEQIAKAVLRDRRGKGNGVVFNPNVAARRWLETTSWFQAEYPTIPLQQALIRSIVSAMRSHMSKKGARTRAHNKHQAKKSAERKLAHDTEANFQARQGTLDL